MSTGNNNKFEIYELTKLKFSRSNLAGKQVSYDRGLPVANSR